MHRIAKLERTSPPRQPRYTLTLSDRAGHGLNDCAYGTEWLDLPDAATTIPSHHQLSSRSDPAADRREGREAEPLPEPPAAATSPDGPGPSSPSKDDSKRIAHKLSEKTRRTRLTVAIREIQKLLPTDDGPGRGPEDPAQSQTDERGPRFVVRPGVPSSKLDVVEMAVGFIKALKERNVEMARRIQEAERRLAECSCRRAREQSAGSALGSAPLEDAK